MYLRLVLHSYCTSLFNATDATREVAGLEITAGRDARPFSVCTKSRLDWHGYSKQMRIVDNVCIAACTVHRTDVIRAPFISGNLPTLHRL